MSNEKLSYETAQTISSLEPSTWIDRHWKHLYTYAAKRIYSKEQASDLVQDTFLAAIENLGKFQHRSSERTWLTGILKNKIFLFYRSNANNIVINSMTYLHPTLYNIYAIELELYSQNDMFNFPDTLVAKEFDFFLEKGLLQLPELWKSVFVMKYLNGTSSREICNTLNLSEQNFWVICSRLKKVLRLYFGKYPR